MRKLLRGDCLERLAELPDGSIDCVIADPPYGTTEATKNKVNGWTAGNFRKFGESWDRDLPLAWIPEAVRALIPGGAMIVWTDTKAITTLWMALEDAGVRPLQTLYWHKTNPPTNPRKNFCSSVEGAVFARKPGRVRYWDGGGATHNLYTCPKVAGVHKVHPTQKPVELMLWCVRLVAPPGGTILDPFMGSGTTGVAAIREGREFVGIERDPGYFVTARERILAEVARLATEQQAAD